MSCAACSTAILLSDESLQCTQGKCNKLYHLLCTGGNKLPDSPGSWVCPECRCATKRGGDNSHTPVGSSKKTRDPNVTYRLKIPTPKPEEGQHREQVDLSADIRSLREEISGLKEQLGSALHTITTYESKLDSYATQVQGLHNKIVEAEMCCACAATSSRVSSGTLIATSISSSAPVKNTEQSPALLANIPQLTRNQKRKKEITTSVTPGLQGPGVPASIPTVSEVEMPQNHSYKSGKNEAVASKNMDGWTTVKRLSDVKKGENKDLNTILAVEKKKHLHVWFLHPDTTVEALTDYVSSVCKTTEVKVSKIKPKFKRDYSSFIIAVPESAYEQISTGAIWPVNAEFGEWLWFRKTAENYAATKTQ